ncbi:MAG: ribose-phosphate diphosphokinase, partial [Clostridiales Family XIII bacterium]|nr:ribose-phosphate diphosphokinase [Clostridiales Family XIII bacterium]
MKHGAFTDFKVFTGNANIELSEEIASIMGKPLGKSTVTKFSDGEISVSLWETVRGVDVFLVQPTCNPINDNLMELLILIDAMKRASAGRINAVIPYYGYARQDRKAKARDPITAKLVADLLSAAGADRVVSMDLHAAQIQGYFNIPVDHLLGMPILVKHFRSKKLKNVVIVSPDHGSVT